MGTGTLYVLDPNGGCGGDGDESLDLQNSGGYRRRRLAGGKLRKEKRALNVTETEESFVVQYLVLGGHRIYVTGGKERGDPWLVASGIHAGSGRQVFGWSEQQRCDLTLFFKSESEGTPSRLYYHNHNGDPWHYTGHRQGCPRGLASPFGSRMTEKTHSRLADNFRRGLAEALSAVSPEKVLFFYSVTDSCQMVHGMRVPGLTRSSASNRSQAEPPQYGSAKECLMAAADVLPEIADAVWLPSVKNFWEPSDLVRAIACGRVTGFVTIQGGCESLATVRDDPAGHRFGFCVQKYRPSWQEVSDFTKDQIAGYFGWHEAGSPENQGRDSRVREFVEKQSARTLCASTFLSEETVSTTYLAWLMAARGFSGFRVTHFLQYSFRHWGADFLEPVLQRRHDCKRAGDLVAAECLKLIGNGSYGYNGLESSNYDDLRLLTDLTLHKRSRSDMAHLKLKHVTFLGIVRVKEGGGGCKARQQKKKRNSSALALDFFSDQAEEANQDLEQEDDSDAADDLERIQPPRDIPPSAAEMFPPYSDGGESEDCLHENLSEDESWRYSHSRHRKLLNKTTARLLESARAGHLRSPPPLASSLQPDSSSESDDDVAAAEVREESGDLEEVLVGRDEGREDAGAAKRSSSVRCVYRFLYAVSVSGQRKKVLNSLPRAVAVLSNSKRLFLSHLDVMFRCLDPCKAELCYVDTDSCIWSLSHPQLDLCLRSDRAAEWERAAIVADENGPKSCHGLMKLEGTYASGLFKNIKMYRLFAEIPGQEETAEDAGGEIYTRCKGVSRTTATKLNNDYFFQAVKPPRAVVHRSTLRPTRAGEIHLVSEAKSLAVPFNLKRRVDSSGVHSTCFSKLQ